MPLFGLMLGLVAHESPTKSSSGEFSFDIDHNCRFERSDYVMENLVS